MSSAVPIEIIAGRRVLFIMATEAEYGPALRSRIAMFNCGVGPVEAGISVASALAGTSVDLAVSLGSAGSARLEHCGLYQVSAVAYRDMDASPFGFPKGVTPFLDMPARLDLPLRVSGLPAATLSTGGSVVADPAAYEPIAEDMVDMETWAVWRACMRSATPLIGLRGISDGHAPVSGLSDWTDYLHVIDEKLSLAIDALSSQLEAGSLL